MNTRAFFDLAYDRYKAELAEGDALYSRMAVLLTTQVILGGGAAQFATMEKVGLFWDRIDAFAYYVCLVSSSVLWAVGIVQLMRAALPKHYPSLDSMNSWTEWRSRYKHELALARPDERDANEAALDSATLDALLTKVSQAQTKCAELNRYRLCRFHAAVRFTVLGLITLAIQIGIYLIWHIKTS